MRILIIGCGRLGAGLARTLVGRDHSVTVVDRDPLAFGLLGDRFAGQTVLGVGFDRDVLLQAGIDRADGVAAVTASDEANVVASRIARDIFRVPKVVARLYDGRKAEIYRRLGIQTIAPTVWGVSRIADLLVSSPLDTVYSIGTGEVDLVLVEVPSLLVGRTVRDLSVIGEVQVVTITRDNKTFLPTLGTLFREGDFLHLAVLTTSAGHLRELLGY